MIMWTANKNQFFLQKQNNCLLILKAINNFIYTHFFAKLMKDSDLTANPQTSLMTKIGQSTLNSLINRPKTFIFQAHLDEMFPFYPQENITYLWLDRRALGYSLRHVKDLFQRKIKRIETFDSVQHFWQRIEANNGNTIYRVILNISVPEEVFDLIQKNRYVDTGIIFGGCIAKFDKIRQKYPKLRNFGRNSGQIIQKTQIECNYQNSMLMQDQDIIIKKYWILFHCLLNHDDKQKAKEDLLSLVRNWFSNEQESIQQFQREYFADQNQQNREAMVKRYMFRNKFYWQLVSTLPKVTHDLRKLVYIRTIVKDMQQTIQNEYKSLSSEQRRQLQQIQIYIVLQLSQEQLYKLKQSLNNYVMSTTFVKGFTDKETVIKYNRIKRYPMFAVSFPAKENSYPDLDFGLIIDQTMTKQETLENGGNVVFGINNFFKVTSVNLQNSWVNLSYGLSVEASRNMPKTWNDDQYRQLLTPNGCKLFDKNKVILSILKQVKNQGIAMSISGWTQEADQYYEALIQDILSRPNHNQVQLDQCYVQKGDNLVEARQYEDAIQEYDKVQDDHIKLLTYIGRVRIHIERRDFTHSQQKLIQNIETFKKWEMPQQYVRLKHYHTKILIASSQNYRQAYRRCRQLMKEIMEKYSSQISFSLINQIDIDQKRCSNILSRSQQL